MKIKASVDYSQMHLFAPGYTNTTAKEWDFDIDENGVLSSNQNAFLLVHKQSGTVDLEIEHSLKEPKINLEGFKAVIKFSIETQKPYLLLSDVTTWEEDQCERINLSKAGKWGAYYCVTQNNSYKIILYPIEALYTPEVVIKKTKEDFGTLLRSKL